MPQRLSFAARVFAGAYFASIAIGTLIWHVAGSEPVRLMPDHILAAVMIAISLAVSYLARSNRLSPAACINLGLVYEVVGSLGIGLDSNIRPYQQGMDFWGISWICVWIIIYPFIVPSPWRKSAVAAFLSAILGPLSSYIWVWTRDFPALPPQVMIGMVVPNLICAVMACVVSRAIFGLGKELDKARQMGSYQLVERISTGGMGEVWKAKHRMLARPAAIKIVRAELLGAAGTLSTVVGRFELEAQATAGLTSPHTVKLFDFGITDDGSFYYVMELLEGLDLETMVERYGPLPPERCVHLLVQACRSLSEAHEQELVHRDIKPANLFVCRQGIEYDFLKVVDFGLVKPRGESGAEASRLSTETAITGTPAYIAPETALGLQVDGRTDLYSLGCVAYWLLTGQPPFDGKSSMEIMMKHVQATPTPLSQRTERSIPPALERIILKCLEKDAARRPATSLELAECLSAIATAEPWTQECARAWWHEHVAKRDTAGERGDASRPLVDPVSI